MDDEQKLADYLALCQAIGHIIVNWALVESQFENWAHISFHHCGGKKIRNSKGEPKYTFIPISFKQRKAFLKDCLKNLPALAAYRDTGLALIARATPLAKVRNDIVHGTLRDLMPNNRIFTFWVRDRVGHHFNVRQYQFKPDQFPDLEKGISGLVKETTRLSQDLTVFLPAKRA